LASRTLPVADDLEWERVHDDPLMALLPLGHPLAGRPSVTLAWQRDTRLSPAARAYLEMAQAALKL
jgi:DNA-binding transcriptional LysR family regulator